MLLHRQAGRRLIPQYRILPVSGVRRLKFICGGPDAPAGYARFLVDAAQMRNRVGVDVAEELGGAAVCGFTGAL